MGVWLVWSIIGFIIILIKKELLLPAAIIFGLGLGFGWW